jgi:ribosome recycling factor
VLHEGVTFDAAASMAKAVQFLDDALRGIQSGAVTAGCIDTVKVPYHGSPTPIKHLAHTADAPGRVAITLYDPSVIGEVAAALTNAGFAAHVFSKTVISVAVAKLSGHDRDKVEARIKGLGEDAKVAVRGVRKQARQQLDKNLSDDARKAAEDTIQRLTADAEARITTIVSAKLQNLG